MGRVRDHDTVVIERAMKRLGIVGESYHALRHACLVDIDNALAQERQRALLAAAVGRYDAEEERR